MQHLKRFAQSILGHRTGLLAWFDESRIYINSEYQEVISLENSNVNMPGRLARGTPDAPDIGQATIGWAIRLDVVIQIEFVGMWSQTQCFDLFGAFIVNPSIQHILGEHITSGQKFMVCFQGIQ